LQPHEVETTLTQPQAGAVAVPDAIGMDEMPGPGF